MNTIIYLSNKGIPQMLLLAGAENVKDSTISPMEAHTLKTDGAATVVVHNVQAQEADIHGETYERLFHTWK